MISLDQFRPISRLEVPSEPRFCSRFPVIDAHSHLLRTQDAKSLVADMDRFNIRLIVDLDGFWDERFDMQVERFIEPYPDRFSIFCRVNVENIDSPDFAGHVRAYLKERVARGATGIKFSKSLGVKIKDRKGVYLKPDDERLRVIWDTAAELDLPVTIHVADPPSFFDEVIDHTHERYEELAGHPHWSYGQRPCPRFAELLDAQESLLQNNPHTRFIVAHVGSHAENLKNVSRMLDCYPNMFVDTAERISELGRQPYTARDFILRYQDRIVYGTDLLPTESNISANYRFFETKDEYFAYNSLDEHNQGRWNIYGVFLPEDVLRKLYFENALRIIPRLSKIVGNMGRA